MKKIILFCFLTLVIIYNKSVFAQENFQRSSPDTYHSYVMVPKAFSPNYDGINDFFKVTGKDITKFEIQVFNRQGQLVYESDNIDDEWDGRYNGYKAQGGIYVWLIVFEGHDKEMKPFKHSIRGNLTLLL